MQTVAEKNPWVVKSILKLLPEEERAGLVTAKLLQTVAEKDPGWVAFILGGLLPEKERIRLRQEMARLRLEMVANKSAKTSDVLQSILVSRQNQR